MPQYSSQNFLTATSFDKLPISTRVDYGFSEFILRKTLNENGFDWVILSTEAF